MNDWIKELAPSTELRKWFAHKAEHFSEFSKLYQKELDERSEAQKEAQQVLELSKKGMVTLLYAAKDPQVNHALVLKAYLEGLAQEN